MTIPDEGPEDVPSVSRATARGIPAHGQSARSRPQTARVASPDPLTSMMLLAEQGGRAQLKMDDVLSLPTKHDWLMMVMELRAEMRNHREALWEAMPAPPLELEMGRRK